MPRLRWGSIARRTTKNTTDDSITCSGSSKHFNNGIRKPWAWGPYKVYNFMGVVNTNANETPKLLGTCLVMDFGDEIYSLAQARKAGNCSKLSCSAGTGNVENTLFLTLTCKENAAFFTRLCDKSFGSVFVPAK